MEESFSLALPPCVPHEMLTGEIPRLTSELEVVDEKLFELKSSQWPPPWCTLHNEHQETISLVDVHGKA